MSKNQWECFAQNFGEWQGSFTTFSPSGELREDIPSLLTLRSVAPQKAEFSLTRESPRYPEPMVMEFSSFSRSLLFFETGAFSQGSMQYAPFGQFGAEFALVTPDRRLRIVQLYNADSELDCITLIREQRVGSTAPEQPHLRVEDLIGEWQGEAITLFPDLQPARTFSSHLTITREADRLIQKLQFGERTIATEATIAGNILSFASGAQILLLPDGASANCPLKASLGQPIVLEAGWLMSPTVRQRIIRSFDAKGAWVSLTLVTERKVG
jgi:Domain of unknown function (DUF3598)